MADDFVIVEVELAPQTLVVSAPDLVSPARVEIGLPAGLLAPAVVQIADPTAPAVIEVALDAAPTVIEVQTPGYNAVGEAAQTFETVSKNLAAHPAVFSYLGSQLVTISYQPPAAAPAILKTLNYVAGRLTSVVLSGGVPGGVPLTKTLTYSGSPAALASVVYS